MQLKLNQDLRTPFGLKLKGEIIEVEVDSNGIPFNNFWRNRLADSAIDGCVEVIFEEQPKKKNK